MGSGLRTWRAVAASVAGARHRDRDTGCEDASAVEVGDDGTLLLVVADGAGSASRAAEGAQRAVGAAMDALRAGMAVGAALAVARAALEPTVEEAAAGVRLGDRATTLLVVRASGDRLETAQIGDGAVVVRCGESSGQPRLEVLAADAKGEYLNETTFLTSPGWVGEVRVAEVPLDGVDGVAALTDGLQLVALDLASGEPHAPFFDPFFRFAGGGGGVDRLEAFLASERVAARTDDDVTLAVAALVSA